jgi:large conductance mechanosensitive channel
LDLAVGIIIGTAFNTIVKSLVNDVLMPVVGLIGGKNVSDASIELVPAVIEGEVIVTEAVMLRYGMFIQSIIDFLIIALTVFVIVKVTNGLKKSAVKIRKRIEEEEIVEVPDEPVAPVVPAAPTSEQLLMEIRDLLKVEKEN